MCSQPQRGGASFLQWSYRQFCPERHLKAFVGSKFCGWQLYTLIIKGDGITAFGFHFSVSCLGSIRGKGWDDFHFL